MVVSLIELSRKFTKHLTNTRTVSKGLKGCEAKIAMLWDPELIVKWDFFNVVRVSVIQDFVILWIDDIRAKAVSSVADNSVTAPIFVNFRN